MRVYLAHASNPDIDGGYWQDFTGVKNRWQIVKDLKSAAKACRVYIDRNGLGGGNWVGGQVVGDDGKIIAQVSYNGRVWTPERDWRERKEITI